MATVTDLNNTTLSGLNYIDALLDVGPDWNYLTPAGDTLLYSFSVTAGNEQGRTGQEEFTLSQQNWVRTAFNELSTITGVKFQEATDGNAAELHFANIDIKDSSNTTGLCSWQSNYSYATSNNQIVSYDADAYIYLDNNEWYFQNRDLTPGGWGYETLLHELGHAMGLKHPFDASINLPAGQDNTTNTLMSYTDVGGPYMHYSQYDIAALNWIYGRDGLGGALGINSDTGARYLTGTSGSDTLVGTASDDTLQGNGGNDTIDGGDGIDTVVFNGPRSSFATTQLASGQLLVSGGSMDGADTLNSVEVLKFTDGSYQRADILNDTTAPVAPVISVAKNANGYAMGNSPLVTGQAEAGSTVNVYLGSTLMGTAQVDSTGVFSLATKPFDDGLGYSIYATATDPSGNVSQHSTSITFNIDAHAPTIPTGAYSMAQGSNTLSFAGNGEVGTTIQLVNVKDASEIGRATVGSDGTWHINSSPLPNADYDVAVVSVDEADNATSSAGRMTFTINSSLNQNGDAANNLFAPGAGNNAIDGKAGLDVAHYDAPRSSFTVAKDVLGYSVTDNAGAGGHDTLVNVERVQFSDGKWLALDIDGAAGQIYRLYQAAFDRTPDAGGFAFWLNAMDHGYSLQQISQYFMNSAESQSMYQADPSDGYFVTQLYHHVLHREPEASGYQWWIDNVDRASRSEVLVMFSESPENQAQVIGTIQNGIEYTPVAS